MRRPSAAPAPTAALLRLLIAATHTVALLANGANNSEPRATCTIAKNIDLRNPALGDKAAKIKADTAEDCCSICGAQPSCASFSWRRWNDFKSGDCYINLRTSKEPEPRISEDCPEHGGGPLCGFVSGCVRQSSSGKCTEEPPLSEVVEQPSILLPLIFAAIPMLYILGGLLVGRAVSGKWRHVHQRQFSHMAGLVSDGARLASNGFRRSSEAGGSTATAPGEPGGGEPGGGAWARYGGDSAGDSRWPPPPPPPPPLSTSLSPADAHEDEVLAKMLAREKRTREERRRARTTSSGGSSSGGASSRGRRKRKSGGVSGGGGSGGRDTPRGGGSRQNSGSSPGMVPPPPPPPEDEDAGPGTGGMPGWPAADIVPPPPPPPPPFLSAASSSGGASIERSSSKDPKQSKQQRSTDKPIKSKADQRRADSKSRRKDSGGSSSSVYAGSRAGTGGEGERPPLTSASSASSPMSVPLLSTESQTPHNPLNANTRAKQARKPGPSVAHAPAGKGAAPPVVCPYQKGENVLYKGADGRQLLGTVASVSYEGVAPGEEPMIAVELISETGVKTVRDTVMARLSVLPPPPSPKADR